MFNDVETVKTLVKSHGSFIYFCKEVLGYKKTPDYGEYKDLTKEHEELCDLLQKKTNKSKLVLMPRFSFKSGVVTIGYSLWRLLRDPNIRILIYSDSATKAQGFLQGIKNHVEGKAPNSRFREFYPKWETDQHKGKWNESQIIISPRKVSHKEPSVDTGGIESSKIGMHYDLIIFDDIVSDLNTTTKAQMDKIHDCYKKSLSLLKPGGDVIITGTRWHYGDAYGRLIAENKERENFDVFIKDAEAVNDEGELLFSSIGLDRTFLDYQRVNQGSYIYSCLYRNNPVDDETALFKIDDFQYYEITPEFHKNMFITCACDPAGEGEDFTAITVVGTDKNKNLYVLDATNKHLKPNQIIDEIIRLNYKWGFDRFAIEKNFFKGMLEAELRRAIEEESKNKQFKPFSVEEVIASVKQRTFTRVLSLQPYHERKAIHLPGKSFNMLPQVFSELAFQMIQFTIDGSKSPNDDLLISLALHVAISIPGGDPAKEGPPPTSAAWIELQSYEELGSRNSVLPSKYRQSYELTFN